MMELLQPYISITLKLVTGMIGILAFLRITGKAQMAQITPLDTVSAFVIGALVGGVYCIIQICQCCILYLP